MTQVDREVEQIQQMFNIGEDQTLLQTTLIDVDQVQTEHKSYKSQGKYNFIEGKNGPTTFLPLASKLGGENTSRKFDKGENADKRYLPAKQAHYVYRKVESGNLINKNMMRQETDQDLELDKMDDTSSDENLHRELIVNNAGKIEITLSEMEQWSILSNVINNVQYDKHPKNLHTMSVRPTNK